MTAAMTESCGCVQVNRNGFYLSEVSLRHHALVLRQEGVAPSLVERNRILQHLQSQHSFHGVQRPQRHSWAQWSMVLVRSSLTANYDKESLVERSCEWEKLASSRKF